MRRFRSGSIADMLFLKQVSDHLRLLLPAVEMAAQAGDHLCLVGGPTLSQGVGFDVLAEQFAGVELRAVAGQPNQAQPLGVVGDEPPGRRRPMHGMSIHDEIDLARGPSEQALHELDEDRVHEFPLEHHEGQGAPIGAMDHGFSQFLRSRCH